MLLRDVGAHKLGEVYGVRVGASDVYLLRSEYACRLPDDAVSRAEDHRLLVGVPLPRDQWLHFADDKCTQPDQYRQSIISCLDNPYFMQKVK